MSSHSRKGEFAESASSTGSHGTTASNTRSGSSTETWTCSPQTSCRQIAAPTDFAICS